MTIVILQALAAGLAGYAIFVFWRRISSASRPIFWIVTAGFLARAVGGQLAFWISYLGLPPGRSLQMGRGIWTFASDADVYLTRAIRAAHSGPMAIVMMNRKEISVFFVQIFSAAMFLFGEVASAALLVNLAAYLGCCAMVLLLGRSGRDRRVIAAVAALSLMPSMILWSLQPLKDVCFLLLVAAFYLAAREYEELWTSHDRRPYAARAALWIVALVLLEYGITGVRWYFGMVIFVVAAAFLALVTVRATGRRLASGAHSVVLMVLLAAAALAGGASYIPPSIRSVMIGRASAGSVPSKVAQVLGNARTGFDRAGARTLVGMGQATKNVDNALSHGSGEPVEGGVSSGTVTVPRSPAVRVLVGIGALILPRFIAQPLGLIQVKGGNGFWLILEIDTILFDLFLLYAIAGARQGIRGGALRLPLFWLVLSVTAAVGGALVYTVSNFGTLFRHRDMILLGVVLLPLVARSR